MKMLSRVAFVSMGKMQRQSGKYKTRVYGYMGKWVCGYSGLEGYS